MDTGVIRPNDNQIYIYTQSFAGQIYL